MLKKELASTINSTIDHKIYAKYWFFQWFNTLTNEKVDFSEVRKFYKKLKKIDPEKAATFRIKNEDENNYIKVPYQNLRESLKNHENTKELIKKAQKSNLYVYISFIDSDTINFNGIYSSYLKNYDYDNKIATVMSTGYGFEKEKEDDSPYIEACKRDRNIRITIARKFPQGVYYPEPNLCILVLKDKVTIEESFIDKKRGDGYYYESPILLTNLFKQRDKNEQKWLFLDENPLITKIPDRIRKIKFSEEFSKGHQPYEDDIKKMQLISQSTEGILNFAKGLYCNRGFSLKDETKIYEFNQCVSQILSLSNESNQTAIDKLKDLISHNQFSSVKYAILEAKFIKELYLELNKSNEYDSSIISILLKFQVDTKDSLEEIYSKIQCAQENDYVLSLILNRYEEDPIHLEFMTRDVNEVLIENPEYYAMARDHYNDDETIDESYILQELKGDRDDNEPQDYWNLIAEIDEYNDHLGNENSQYENDEYNYGLENDSVPNEID